MKRADRAEALHEKGYNCCQAAACVFAEDMGIDESLLYKVCEGFGAGMGTEKGVCGALSGAAIVAGYMNSDGDCENAGQTKKHTYSVAGEIQEKFVSRVGALICGDIKRGNNGGPYTSCNNCIRTAIETAEEVLGL